MISFESDLKPSNSLISKFISAHGDTIRDIAFEVDDCQKIYDNAIRRGAKSISPPTKVEDENGYVITSSILGFGDTVHTLVERVTFSLLKNNYNGLFLPGFRAHYLKEPINEFFNDINIIKIDHVGIPQPMKHMKPVTEHYFKVFDFHHFWSVDEKIIASQDSSLRTTVVSDFDEKVKMPVFEPAPGQKISQIQVLSYYSRSLSNSMEVLELNTWLCSLKTSSTQYRL